MVIYIQNFIPMHAVPEQHSTTLHYTEAHCIREEDAWVYIDGDTNLFMSIYLYCCCHAMLPFIITIIIVHECLILM